MCQASGRLSFQQLEYFCQEESLQTRGQSAPPFHLLFGLRFRGDLKIERLDAALRLLTERHAALRTYFVPNCSQRIIDGSNAECIDGNLRISDESQLVLNVSEYSLLGAKDGEDLRDFIERCSSNPFDLSTAPLIRWHLLRFSVVEHLLVGVIHHLVCDLWSVSIIRSEVMLLYARLIGGSEDPLPKLQMSSVEIRDHQESYLSNIDSGAAVRYWREQWNKIEHSQISPQDLSFAYRWPRGEPFEVSTGSVEFTDHEAAVIRQRARRNCVTVYVFVLAAVVRVLARVVGRRHIAVWANFANRLAPKTWNVVGWFAQSHLLGFDCSYGQTVTELLEQARSVVLEALTYQELPLQVLWRLEGVKRARRDARFIKLDARVFHDSAARYKVGSDVTVEEVSLPYCRHGRAGFHIDVVQKGSKIAVIIQYSRAWFSAERVDSFLASIRQSAIRIASDRT
jgi:hypothetical protein